MNIAFLLHTFPGIGGTESVTLSLAQWLDDNHVNCYLISWKQGHHGERPHFLKDILFLNEESDIDSSENFQLINDFLIHNNITTVINQGPFWLGKAKRSSLTDKVKVISVLHYAPCFRMASNKYTIERLFKNSEGKNLTYKLKTGIRYCFSSHFAKKDFKKKDLPLLRSIVDNSDAFVLLCQGYVNEMATLLQTKDTSKLTAISNPIVHTISYDKQKLSQKQNVLLFVGRLTAWDKRVDRLLNIWKHIQHEFQDWQLLIIGDGEERESLECLALTLKLQRVQFKGFCNPEKYYEMGSILCSTSSSEGFPMTFCEAASYGVSVISYNVSQGVEFVINTLQHGILVEPFDELSYSTQLRRLMRLKSERNILAENGLRNIKKLNIERIGEKWIKLINQVQK